MSATLTFPTTLSSQIAPYLPPSDHLKDGDASVPWVTLTFATSLDSALSLSPGVQTLLSGPLSKAMTHHLRSFHSAILVGVSTAVADDPGLNCRIEGVVGNGIGRQPIPIVLDPKGRWQVHEGSRVVKTAKEGNGKAPFVIVSSDIDAAVVQDRDVLLKQCGGGYIRLAVGGNGKFKWEDILSTLKSELRVQSVMIEGGASVINSLLENEASRKLVDSVIITIAPTWLGKGGVVVSPERQHGESGGYSPPRLNEVKWLPMGEDVVLCGRL
ncbi:hypothetical protein H072_10848 [Dactylellina haptotyla CBS 200.50]|uniref:2,5-diamino-6-ribosylamino-4(3H)-pyrimidinone 5'-phosphate reductase n=1 Tax=Dactylellina haptotyla (strain CBS 200.50) TaxID=1284197 RepID=S8A3L2_DACHA|nr:hypothetical protein H072_10848 [Dactylellina haptotyla CBS 200.50]